MLPREIPFRTLRVAEPAASKAAVDPATELRGPSPSGMAVLFRRVISEDSVAGTGEAVSHVEEAFRQTEYRFEGDFESFSTQNAERPDQLLARGDGTIVCPDGEPIGDGGEVFVRLVLSHPDGVEVAVREP